MILCFLCSGLRHGVVVEWWDNFNRWYTMGAVSLQNNAVRDGDWTVMGFRVPSSPCFLDLSLTVLMPTTQTTRIRGWADDACSSNQVFTILHTPRFAPIFTGCIPTGWKYLREDPRCLIRSRTAMFVPQFLTSGLTGTRLTCKELARDCFR